MDAAAVAAADVVVVAEAVAEVAVVELPSQFVSPRVGVGYRAQLADWLLRRPEQVGCLEITAEHFYDGGEARLEWLRNHYPLFVHGLGLSLGSDGPLDRVDLRRFARVAA